MAKKYMIGTLSDYPLLKVELDGVNYLVHEKDRKVYKDEPGIPQVKDQDTVNAVMDKAKES